MDQLDELGPIARRYAEILDHWARETGELAAARGLSEPELMNMMPKYLAALAPLDGSREKRQRRVESHLSARLRAGYRLDDILTELTLLGRCVVRTCVAPDALTPTELAALHEALQQDAAFVIGSFAVYLRDDEQAERSYVRRLQALSDAAAWGDLADDARERPLRAMLELMMEAVGARSATLALYDTRTQAPWASASAGAPPLARPDEMGAPGPEGVSDVAMTALAVSDTLRESGIHGLLAVQLPTGHGLVGTMYVGLAEGERFSSRQVRRMESLGEHLARCLDRARLEAALAVTTRALMAERETRERLVAVLAHDLRGPLSVMRMCATLLAGDADRLGDHRDLPARALRSVVHAERMTHDLLDVLRVRAGHGLPLLLAECDLAVLARSTLEELAVTLGPRFELLGADAVPGVWSPDTVQRALWNLATNAVKYGAEGTPIVVTLRPSAAAVALSVHNAGPVIPASARAALFEPFTRFTIDGANDRPGWGLGLTMVKSCAEAHGGSVAVESTAALGTTFTMTLPRDARSLPSAALASPR